ncbi:1-deoxy-D-xylulose-5-phosphate synthase [Bifidobacterium sp. 64T4]|uniref:1-deoxy-D-xylulose-5-phosphate synthase n=1 Tax=Bifidobacterium pongonis TaxID=2834432 RepID=UPI001C566D4E|nr:1-deoxy-D-xylulose-5-phosphate synthase [Bifidobacterium pongonis]MBW3094761.1 1-deoxy-D-xylulose-5-phosphate synthase [Bifidobacterium pongonis]
MTNYLDHIDGPADLKRLSREQLPALADEIRHALITKVSATGGHMGPNLGVVEATIAMHYVFDSPRDKFIWDVFHQSYTHKILTGRKQAFLDPAHYHDVSGYTHPGESEHDHFVIGHTGTSISLAVGMAKGRDLNGRKENVIAFIGDGSLSEGEALEGLDNAGAMTTNLIIIVNDNEMSIAPNHGGIYGTLAELRATNGTAEHNLFRDFGLDYRYVENGNDVNTLIDALAEVKDIDHPVVVHIHTDKGRGLERVNVTREAKEFGHWMLPQAVQDAMAEAGPAEDYASVSCAYLLDKMKRDKRVVVLSAGTPGNGGFGPKEREQAGEQFVDVGIAEQHAVAAISGIAKAGGKPVYEVASTFLQRAYDQLQQDLALQGTAATIIVAGFGDAIGPGDNTHSNIFDIAMTNTIPGLTGLAPATVEEYLAMLDWSIDHANRPVVIAEPGTLTHEADLTVAPQEGVATPFTESDLKYRTIVKGSKVAILALGNFLPLGLKVRGELAQSGIDATVIDPRVYSDLDVEALEALKDDHDVVVTMEDGALVGGFGQRIAGYYGPTGMRVLNYGAAKEITDLEPTASLYQRYRLNPELVAEDVLKAL